MLPDHDEPGTDPHAALECVVVRPDRHAVIADQVTLRLRGELNPYTSSLVPVLVDEQLLDGQTTIHLDMGEVARIDCASVGQLVACHAACLALGAKLVIREPSVAVAQVLELTPNPLVVEPGAANGTG